MKRLLLLLCVLTAVVGCKPDFRRRTARYASVGELRERRAAVLDTVDGAPRWGYVDAEGRLVILCRYAAAAPFSEGRAAVQIPGERWGYIDTTGLMVIAPEYAVASPFADSLAWVELPGGLRGRSGRAQRPPRLPLGERRRGGALPLRLHRTGRRTGVDGRSAQRPTRISRQPGA